MPAKPVAGVSLDCGRRLDHHRPVVERVQGSPVESLVSLTNTQSLVTPFGARCFMKPNMYPAMRRIWISSVPSVMR